MSPSHPPGAAPELLLAHALWIRRLAAKLVRDADRADELTQETWKRLLERPPELDRPFRGWIATVMRNLVRAEHRGALRRGAREAESARNEATPSSHELFERAALQRELVQAVMELGEPYRTVVLLRYFEDLTPSAIAARERIPLATVKTRLQRGLAQLRERLARTHAPDGRSNALVALAALAQPDSVLPLAVSVAMNLKVLVPLAVLGLSGLAFWLYPREDSRDSMEARAGRARTAELAPAETVAGASGPTPTSRSTRETVAPVARPAAAAAAPAGTLVLGDVIDLTGRPLGGLEIAWAKLGSAGLPEGVGTADHGPTGQAQPPASPRESDAHTGVSRSAADGSFELRCPGPGRLFVRDPQWVTLLSGTLVAATSGQRCCIVVAPAIALSGLCLDEAGAPLAGALVTLAPPRDLRARLAVVLDFSEELPFTTQSDAAGRFRFERAPALPDGVLAARLAEYRVHEEPAPPFARHDLVLVLERERDTTRRLTGQVVGPRGEPLEDALVALGLDTTRTNGEGRFSFDLADEKSFNRRARAWMHVREDRLRALKPGYLPSELVAITRAGEEQPQWPSPLVLRLAGTPLALTGRVLDERGEALAGMRVWLADPSFFGGVRRNEREDFPAFVQSESLLAGAEPGWNFALSGADGSFRLEGLLERDYTVAAMDPHSLLRCEEAGVAAGSTDVRLVLDRSQLFARLAGVVVDGRDEPVAGLEVFAMCDALVSRLDGEIVGTQHEVAAGVVTDAEGRFELVNVPRTLAYLRLQGAETIPLEWGRGLAGGLAQLAGEEPERVRITVERRCHFRVELADPGLADELAMLDADGRELVISEFQGSSRNETERHALIGGHSNTLAVSDRARELVLYRAGVPVRRTNVLLRPGEPLTLQL